MKIVWYKNRLNIVDAMKFNIYYQVLNKPSRFLFSVKDFDTITIKLDSEDDIKKLYSKNCRYEVNRAEKEGLIFSSNINIEDFIYFYNDFAVDKNLEKISISTLNYPLEDVEITAILYKEDVLVMHSYFLDKDNNTVRLLHSCSNLHKQNCSEIRKIIGWGNRLLHHSDMLYFKNKGYLTYDFGGINLKSTDASILGINRFKESFGGDIIRNYIAQPLWLELLIKVKKYI